MMDRTFPILSICLSLVLCCYGDVYMHNPRGSNNRLNEKSANRNNANRLFDSQNNNRGGYNKGDATDQPFRENNRQGYLKQYDMKYFQSSKDVKSKLMIEWTNQHGLGSENKKLISNMVIQYMCQKGDKINFGQQYQQIRDGVNRGTQPFPRAHHTRRWNPAVFAAIRRRQVNQWRGLHESYESYHRCSNRKRNKGLFIADQKVRGEAIHTRQNPNGNRRGYECPEERDYFPYWHPSQWKDIAVLTSDKRLCDFYKKESFNVKPRHECVQRGLQSSHHNNEGACKSAGGKWTKFENYLEILSPSDCNNNAVKNRYKARGFDIKWADIYDHDNRKKACIVSMKEPPECLEVDFTRVNHLGNGKDMRMMNYEWNLPYFPSERNHRCVLRLRYNISTADYDPWNTGSKSNNANFKGKKPKREPLIKNDPKVKVGIEGTRLQLAINTAQFGRTFQDRSHVFVLSSRKNLPNSIKNKVIHNFNVRGKRGNIVQTYPANEYDFTPTVLNITEDEVFHVQWTGSNTHNNGRPGGDGQTGDAGEGRGGTDRNNMLPLKDLNTNFPMALEKIRGNIFQKCQPLWLANGNLNKLDKLDVAIQFASSGFYQCEKSADCGGQSVQTKNGFNPKLDTSPASFQGAIFKCPRGTYHVVCTRNNNFTNRSQKATINVAKKA